MVRISKLAFTGFAALAAAAPIEQTILNLANTNLTTYSSDFTRNIFVIGAHSHNDYWRDVPLYTALSYGVQSVEVDVWHFEDDDEDLYVGHHQGALNSNRTFASLYVDPLVEILDRANPENELTETEEGVNGVFDTNTDATLYLFVDVKTNGTETWPYIIDALEPLREKGYLTTFNGTEINYSAVTVIGTGNTPYDFVSSQETRDYFYDGPLATLNDSYPVTLNPIASSSLKNLVGAEASEIASTGLNETQFDALKTYIDTAHDLGIKTRVWEVTWWPIQKRDALTRQLVEAGSDFLNADDLDWIKTFV